MSCVACEDAKEVMVHEEIARPSEDGPKSNVLVHNFWSLGLYSAQAIFSAVLG